MYFCASLRDMPNNKLVSWSVSSVTAVTCLVLAMSDARRHARGVSRVHSMPHSICGGMGEMLLAFDAFVVVAVLRSLHTLAVTLLMRCTSSPSSWLEHTMGI
jgi:hypothetical protein